MALTVTHTFVSGKTDDPTAAADGQVLPSHWNDEHEVTGTLPASSVTGLANVATSGVYTDLGGYGDFVISSEWPTLHVSNNVSGNPKEVAFEENHVFRFSIGADGTSESGSNAGSNFYIKRHADNGAELSTSLSVNRATGLITLGNKVVTAAPTTSAASLNLPHGTAPTSPSNGDLWTTTSGLYARVNGATVGPYIAGAAGGMSLKRTTVLTASGTWNPTGDAVLYLVEVIGGGGSGGTGDSSWAVAGGGGAPGCVSHLWIAAASVASSCSYTIGAGGAQRSGNNTALDGNAGTMSSITLNTNLVVSAAGGDGGKSGGSVIRGAGGNNMTRYASISNPSQYMAVSYQFPSSVGGYGVGTNQTGGGQPAWINGFGPGAGGGGGVFGNGASAGAGAASCHHSYASGTGGGGAGGSPGSNGGNGTAPYFGQGGGGGKPTSSGSSQGDAGNGGIPGGGGGGGGVGTTWNSNSGSGARGEIRIYEFG